LGFELSVGASPESLTDPVELIVKNDATTPMEFVVQILREYLQQEKSAAIQTMLHVHTEGEYPVAILERPQAEQLISRIRIEAEKRDFPLAAEARPL